MARFTIDDIAKRQDTHEQKDDERFAKLQKTIDHMAPQIATIHQYFQDNKAVNLYKINLKRTIQWILIALGSALGIIISLHTILGWLKK